MHKAVIAYFSLRLLLSFGWIAQQSLYSKTRSDITTRAMISNLIALSVASDFAFLMLFLVFFGLGGGAHE